MAAKRVAARRQRTAQKSKPSGTRAKAKARKQPAPKKPAKKSAPKRSIKSSKTLVDRQRTESVAPSSPAVRGSASPAQAVQPHAFWDPKGTTTDFRGDAKAHTKPNDQRAHIRMRAPRTWSSRQSGRG